MKPCPHALVASAATVLIGACWPVMAHGEMSFETCIAAMRRDRVRHPQVRADTFETYVRDALDLRPAIRAATRRQPEFELPIWDYVARLVDPQRIADGLQMVGRQQAVLRAIALRHGIDTATIVAVFGVETDYGKVEGRYRVIDATLSRACLDLESSERKKHFFAALWLLQEGYVAPETFRGSWAGAFGLTQFMPGTFVANRADGDGSGTIDIVGSVPDALATTASYISSLGWVEGLRWGVEVSPPKPALSSLVAAEDEHACLARNGPDERCRTVEQWAAMGVAAVAGTKDSEPGTAPLGLPAGTRAALIAPAGTEGPAWLVTSNFHAIWQYNRADAYALAIGLLSDALRGDPPMRSAWGTDDPGISRAEFRQLQQDLFRLGHEDVVADGFDGPVTREAIRSEERLRGWPETGRAGARIARMLREQAGVEPDAKATAPTENRP